MHRQTNSYETDIYIGIYIYIYTNYIQGRSIFHDDVVSLSHIKNSFRDTVVSLVK